MDSIIVEITINFHFELTHEKLRQNGPNKFCERHALKY